MATTSNKLADVPQPVSGSDVLSANLLCVQNGRVTQVPGYLKKISDTQKSVDDLKAAVFDMIYPVGSYYWSSNATNPGSIFGGTWEQIKDRFVLAAGGTYAVNATGGEAMHTLTVNEMPSHAHDVNVRVKGYDGWSSYTSKNYGVMFNMSSDATGYHSPNYSAHSASVTADADTGANGNSQPHNNMPPYIVAYCWHRTA